MLIVLSVPGMNLDRGGTIEGQSTNDEQNTQLRPSKKPSSMPKPDPAAHAQPRSDKAAQRTQDFLKGLTDHTLKEQRRLQADMDWQANERQKVKWELDNFKTAVKAQAHRSLAVREHNELIMKIAEQPGEHVKLTDIMQPDLRVFTAPMLPAFMLQPRPEESVFASPPAIV